MPRPVKFATLIKNQEIARIAQLVEQRTENPRVGSSILPPGIARKAVGACLSEKCWIVQITSVKNLAQGYKNGDNRCGSQYADSANLPLRG